MNVMKMTHLRIDRPGFIEVTENGDRFFYFSESRQLLCHKDVKKCPSEGSFLSRWVTPLFQKDLKKVLSNV